MKQRFFQLLSLLVLLALVIFTPVQAAGFKQAEASNLTLQLSDLSFSGPLNLSGPYQETRTEFGLPADWALNAPAAGGAALPQRFSIPDAGLRRHR